MEAGNACHHQIDQMRINRIKLASAFVCVCVCVSVCASASLVYLSLSVSMFVSFQIGPFLLPIDASSWHTVKEPIKAQSPPVTHIHTHIA